MLSFNNKIKNIFFHQYMAIDAWFPITKNHVLEFLKEKLSGFFFLRRKELCFNFIITSKAEIRVFTPILNYIIDNTVNLNSNIFFAKKDLYFDTILEKKINNCKYITVRSSPFYLVNNNCVILICLDHKKYKKAHKIGISIIETINKKNTKTVCIQHGGNQDDYIEGQLTSKSINQIVFGKLIYNRFLQAGFHKNHVFLTGNPLHDKLVKTKQNLKLKNSRKIIALITCMHTEYDNQDNPEACYIEYLKNIYQSINFEDCILIIKMHPYDSLKDNLYERVMLELNLSTDNIKIIQADNLDYSVYDLISASDLILSRASTIIEEALILKKNVIAYDLFEEGSSMYYNFLLKYSSYSKVIKDPEKLASVIRANIKKPLCNKNDIAELIKNSTYKLDGKSTSRIIDALRIISKT